MRRQNRNQDMTRMGLYAIAVWFFVIFLKPELMMDDIETLQEMDLAKNTECSKKYHNECTTEAAHKTAKCKRFAACIKESYTVYDDIFEALRDRMFATSKTASE